MPLALIAASSGATPAVLSALAGRSLGAPPSVRRALLSNVNLPAELTVDLLRRENLPAVHVLEVLTRPGLSGQDALTFMQAVPQMVLRQVPGSTAAVPGWAHRVVLDLLAEHGFRDRSWFSHVAHPHLRPEMRLAALQALLVRGALARTAWADLAFALSHHPTVAVALARSVRQDDARTYFTDVAARAVAAADAGGDPVAAHLAHVRARAVNGAPLELAELLHDPTSIATSDYLRTHPTTVEQLLASPRVPQEDRQALMARRLRVGSSALSEILQHADRAFVSSSLAQVHTPPEVLAFLPLTDLSVADLNRLWALNTQMGSNGQGFYPRERFGAWLATHPRANASQRTRGLRACQDSDAYPIAAAGQVAACSGPVAAGGCMPATGPATGWVNRPTTSLPKFTHHARTFAQAYLAAALPAVATESAAVALVGLAPGFTGTLHELLTTACAVGN